MQEIILTHPGHSTTLLKSFIHTHFSTNSNMLLPLNLHPGNVKLDQDSLIDDAKCSMEAVAMSFRPITHFSLASLRPQCTTNLTNPHHRIFQDDDSFCSTFSHISPSCLAMTRFLPTILVYTAFGYKVAGALRITIEIFKFQLPLA